MFFHCSLSSKSCALLGRSGKVRILISKIDFWELQKGIHKESFHLFRLIRGNVKVFGKSWTTVLLLAQLLAICEKDFFVITWNHTEEKDEGMTVSMTGIFEQRHERKEDIDNLPFSYCC